MDALSDLIRMVRLSRAAFLMGRYAAPWCFVSSAAPGFVSALLPEAQRVVAFHLMTEGECHARLEGDSAPPLRLTAGDLLVVPRGDAHRMGSPIDAVPMTDMASFAKPIAGATNLLRLEIGGSGAVAGMVCGFLEVDEDLSDPLLTALPRMFRVRLEGGPAAAWIEASMRLGVSETLERGPGSMALLSSLAESLFADAVRRYSETVGGDGTGWLAGLRDPVVGRALALGPDDALAELIGEPPMRYLTQWRLRLAALQLRASDRGLADIANQAGYASESAFNRAFKRELGVPPASWRKRARGRAQAAAEPVGARPSSVEAWAAGPPPMRDHAGSPSARVGRELASG
jgi:hypothetical protein